LNATRVVIRIRMNAKKRKASARALALCLSWFSGKSELAFSFSFWYDDCAYVYVLFCMRYGAMKCSVFFECRNSNTDTDDARARAFDDYVGHG
jgi:hypothetical protein